MMVTIKKISRIELNDLILISYKGDTEGLQKFHIKPYSLEEAVESTLNIINEESKSADFSYYKICYQHIKIGYFVITDNVLYSFCINKRYRKPKIVLEWWQQVVGLFKNGFYTAVYSNNTRALAFLKRRGMKEISHNNNIITLVNLY